MIYLFSFETIKSQEIWNSDQFYSLRLEVEIKHYGHSTQCSTFASEFYEMMKNCHPLCLLHATIQPSWFQEMRRDEMRWGVWFLPHILLGMKLMMSTILSVLWCFVNAFQDYRKKKLKGEKRFCQKLNRSQVDMKCKSNFEKIYWKVI